MRGGCGFGVGGQWLGGRAVGEVSCVSCVSLASCVSLVSCVS